MAGKIEPREVDGGAGRPESENAAERTMEDPQARQPLKREGEPTMAQLLDPVAWERRLQEARARRAEALAGRGRGEEGARPAAPRSHGPAAAAAIGASAGPALSADSRATPAARPAVSEHASPSIRDLARAERLEPAAQPDMPAQSVPAPRRTDLPAGGSRVFALPLAARRPAPASDGPRPEPRPRAFPAREPATEEHLPADGPDLAAALPVPAGSPPLSGDPGRAGRLEIPDVDDASDASGDVYEAEPAPALPPHAAGAPRRGGWTRSRLALVFAAGLGLGLAGALTLTEPVLERVDEFASRAPERPTATDPSAAGSPAPAGPGTDAVPAQSEVDAPKTGAEEAPTASAETAPEPGAEEDAPAVAEDLAARDEDGWEPAAAPADELDLPLGARPAEPAEVAALPPPATAPDLPRPEPGIDLPAPGTVEAPFLSLPTVIPQPDAPAPVETARLAEPPSPLDAPALPGSPDPEAVAGAADVGHPGILAAARPRARPGGLAPAGPEAEAQEPVDLAALTPDLPDAPPAASEAEPAPPAAGAPDRVLVHVPSALSSPDAEAAIGAIEAAGFTPSGRIDVQIPIGSTNVRYYFPEDAAAARAMAEAITARTGQDAQARDFTGFRPRPAEGTVEVWLAGQPRSAPAPQPQRVASPPPAVPAPPPVQPRVQPQPPAPVATRRLPTGPSTSAEAAMRDLEVLADEIARAIARSLNE